VIVAPVKKRNNIKTLGGFRFYCIPDTGQNDFTNVMSTENQSNICLVLFAWLHNYTCNSLASSIAVWSVPNTIPTTTSLHLQAKQFLFFHQLIHLVHFA